MRIFAPVGAGANWTYAHSFLIAFTNDFENRQYADAGWWAANASTAWYWNGSAWQGPFAISDGPYYPIQAPDIFTLGGSEHMFATFAVLTQIPGVDTYWENTYGAKVWDPDPGATQTFFCKYVPDLP